MNEPSCYKCGRYILDGYPSHLCKLCRNAISIGTADLSYESRITAADAEFLRRNKINPEVRRSSISEIEYRKTFNL